MTKTNSGLIEYVKAKVGCYYWYGTFGQMANNALYQAKKNQYPKYYTASDFNSQINHPKQVFDCAGLIKAYLWTDSIDDVTPTYKASQDYGATAFYNHCTIRGKISSFDRVPGRLVFKGKDSKMSHVGVYIGDGKIIEAKGHKYGVVESKLDGNWTHWGQCNLITDSNPPEEQKPHTEPVTATKEYVVRTNTGVPLRLRAKPTTSSSVLARIPYGTRIEALDEVNGWVKTKYGGKTGYCSKTYLK